MHMDETTRTDDWKWPTINVCVDKYMRMSDGRVTMIINSTSSDTTSHTPPSSELLGSEISKVDRPMDVPM